MQLVNLKAKSQKQTFCVDGQALIEVVVSMSVVTIGLFGMLTLLSRSIGLNRVVRENYQATYLAAEGIEIVKNVIDTNLLQGSATAWNCGFQDGKDYEVDYQTETFDATNCVGGIEATLVPAGDPFRKLLFDVTQPAPYSYSSGDDTPFVRKISIKLNPNSPASGGGSCDPDLPVEANCEEVQVNSTVTWGSSGVELEDHFYKTL